MTIFGQNKNFGFLGPGQNWAKIGPNGFRSVKKIAQPNLLGNISKCHQEDPNNMLKQKNCIYPPR